MRMSVLFALTSVFTAFNLVFMPFLPVMMLWAFCLSVAFIIVNIIADRLRLWSGIAWGMAAAVIVAFMLNGAQPDEENRVCTYHFIRCTSGNAIELAAGMASGRKSNVCWMLSGQC